MTPEEKFLHYLQLRRDAITDSQGRANYPEWMRAQDQQTLLYLDFIESDFHRAFGRETE